MHQNIRIYYETERNTQINKTEIYYLIIKGQAFEELSVQVKTENIGLLSSILTNLNKQ